MSFPTVFRAVVLANSGVSDLVAARMYPMKLPQKPTFPAITYLLIDGDPHLNLQGNSSLHWAQVRVNAWGLTYGDAHVLANKIETAINGQTFTTLRSIVGKGMRDLYEPAVDAYYATQDFSVWHTEST